MPIIWWKFEERGVFIPLGLWNLVEMPPYGKSTCDEDDIEKKLGDGKKALSFIQLFPLLNNLL